MATKWKPQVVHGHDWQAGFVPEYLNELEAGDVPFVFTIHNIAFHGNTGADRLASLGLSDWRFEVLGLLEQMGCTVTRAGDAVTVDDAVAEVRATMDDQPDEPVADQSKVLAELEQHAHELLELLQSRGLAEVRQG